MSCKAQAVTIKTIKRLKNSRNGNPRYQFTFTNGVVMNTLADTSFCYLIGNPGYQEGSTVRIQYARGCIIDMSGDIID